MIGKRAFKWASNGFVALLQWSEQVELAIIAFPADVQNLSGRKSVSPRQAMLMLAGGAFFFYVSIADTDEQLVGFWHPATSCRVKMRRQRNA